LDETQVDLVTEGFFKPPLTAVLVEWIERGAFQPVGPSIASRMRSRSLNSFTISRSIEFMWLSKIC
jgi:hypothetical protein